PRRPEHGDWATNVALALAPHSERPSRELAELLAARIERDDVIERVEIAGPGFINLFLGPGWVAEALGEVLAAGDRFGRHTGPPLGRLQVELVSANPTGPLHVGTARNAAIGDALANVLEASGYEVEREYYFNDAGRQMELFAESVEARYLPRFGIEAEIPEGGYQGEYVNDLAGEIAAEHSDALLPLNPAERRRRLLLEAVERTIGRIRATLERFRVRIDTWRTERELLESGAVDDVVRRLREADHAYEADGAVFFRASAFGDEKDRVLIRSNGEPTYFAKDCAYLLDKDARGFSRLVYVWGADHHGTVKRLKGAAKALGVSAGVEVVLYQLVAFSRGGQPVRMSKRTGEMISLDELLDEVGPDAARYTLLTRSSDSPVEFDIEVVTRQTLDNPVFYVQYAHARIASILRRAVAQGVILEPWNQAGLGRLRAPTEVELVRTLAELPDVLESAAAAMAPHRLTHFAEQVAAAFHRFYTECRVLSDDASLTQARLWLCTASKLVLGITLGLLGVSAPESMERIGDDDV
ncbi:MAG: arginine--tRNA ligase, partial [Actinobacteria bacterium]|nr:arginine--tRNA ligase [Actinomycetota bacterium]